VKKDFQDFIQSQESPAKKLDRSVIGLIKQELDPNPWIVFSKLALVQGFIGLITMLFCPQFEFSLTANHGLFHFFHHHFGEQGCMVACGSVFLGTGAIFASYLLNAGEVRKIKESAFLYYSSIAGLSVALFLMAGAQIYFNLVIFWLAGSILSGIGLFKLNEIIRHRIAIA
jgi:hypothetical protein